MGSAQGRRSRIELLAGVLQRQSRSQATYDHEEVRSAIRFRIEVGRHRQRHPDVELVRQLERLGQDADDRVGVVADGNRLADRGRVPTESRAPEGVAEHENAVAARRLLVGVEPTAELWRDPERGQERRRAVAQRDVDRLRGGGQIGAVRRPGTHPREAVQPGVVLPVLDGRHFGYGSGARSTPRTTLKTAVLAPMASASVSTTVSEKDFARRRVRAAKRICRNMGLLSEQDRGRPPFLGAGWPACPILGFPFPGPTRPVAGARLRTASFECLAQRRFG